MRGRGLRLASVGVVIVMVGAAVPPIALPGVRAHDETLGGPHPFWPPELTETIGGKALGLDIVSSEMHVNGLDYVEHHTDVSWSCSYDSDCFAAGLDLAIDVWAGGPVVEANWSFLNVEFPVGSLVPFPLNPVKLPLLGQDVAPNELWLTGLVWVFPILIPPVGGGAAAMGGEPTNALSGLEAVASGAMDENAFAAAALPYYLEMLQRQEVLAAFEQHLGAWASWLRTTDEGRAWLASERLTWEQLGWPAEALDGVEDASDLPKGIGAAAVAGMLSQVLEGPIYGALRDTFAPLRQLGKLDDMWNPLTLARAMGAYRDALALGDSARLHAIQEILAGLLERDEATGAPAVSPREFERALGRIASLGPLPGAAEGPAAMDHGQAPLEPLHVGLGMVCIFCGGFLFGLNTARLLNIIGPKFGIDIEVPPLNLHWDYRSLALPGPLGALSQPGAAPRVALGVQVPFPHVLVYVLLGLGFLLPEITGFLFGAEILIPAEVLLFLFLYNTLGLLFQELDKSCAVIGFPCGTPGIHEIFKTHCGGDNLGLVCIFFVFKSLDITLDPVALPVMFFGLKDPLAAIAGTGKEMEVSFVLINIGFEAGRAEVFETVETAAEDPWHPLPYTGRSYELGSLFYGPGPGFLIETYDTEVPAIDRAGLYTLHTHIDSYDIDERGPELPADTSYNNANELLHDQPLWDAFSFVIAKPLDLVLWTEPSPRDALEQARGELAANKALRSRVHHGIGGCGGEGFAALERAARDPCGLGADALVGMATDLAGHGFSKLFTQTVAMRKAIYAMSDAALDAEPGTTEELVEHGLVLDDDLGEEVLEADATRGAVADDVQAAFEEGNLPAETDALSPTQRDARHVFLDPKEPAGRVGVRVHEVYDAEMLVNLEFRLIENALAGLESAVADLGSVSFDDLVHGRLTLSDPTLDLLGESVFGSTVAVLAPAPGAGATVVRPDRDEVNPLVPADFLLNVLHGMAIQGFVADGGGADWLAFRNPVTTLQFVPYGGMFAGAEASEDPVGQAGGALLHPVASVRFHEFHDLVLPMGNVFAVPEGEPLGAFLRDYDGVLTSPDDTHPSTAHQLADVAATALLGLRYTARNSGDDTDVATNLGWTEAALLLEALIGLGPKAIEAGVAASEAAARSEAGEGPLDVAEPLLAFAEDETNTKVQKRAAGANAIGAACLKLYPPPIDAGVGVGIPLVLDARAVVIAPPVLSAGGDWDRVAIEVAQDSGSAIAVGAVDPLFRGVIKPLLDELLGAVPGVPPVPGLDLSDAFDPFACPG